MAIEVMAPGALSSFQDLGRHGEQKHGIFVGGAMDEVSHRLANALVGNPPTRATLEITLMGPTLLFREQAVIALSGGDLDARLDGQPMSNDQAFKVAACSRLSFGTRRSGARAYLAVAGGYRLDNVLGSEGTALKAGFGGYHGRPLAKGDIVELSRHAIAVPKQASVINWPEGLHPLSAGPLRILPGRHWDWFDGESCAAFIDRPFRLLPQSSRMGYRLQGHALTRTTRREVISEPVRFGTVQVPPDGQPIVLMADRQTIGGYPRIAEVIDADIPRLAQLSPDDEIRFSLVDLDTAERLLRERDMALAQCEVART